MPNGLHLAPGSPLRRAADRPSRGERRHIGRFIGVLYVAGAALGALSLLLPHRGASTGALAVIVGAAVCIGAALTALHRRVPIWAAHAVTALAAPMVALAVYFSGDPGSVYALMLVWPVLLTAYYFRRWHVAVHLSWILATYGAALVAMDDPHHFSPVTRWLLTAIALAVTGVLTSRLVARRREAELAYRHLAAIIDSSQDAVVSVTLDGTIASWNDGAERLYGYSAEEAIGQPGSMLAPPDRAEEISTLLARLVHGEHVDHYETVRRRRDGSTVDVSLTLSPICDEDGEVIGASAAARDITARRRSEIDRAQLIARIRSMARTDPLTELANRRAWDDELDRELARAERRGAPIAVAMLDLDRFKLYNDEHGHLAGDELLRAAAAAWRAELRKTDFIARYGGEEFAVLLSDCSSEEAGQTVERLRRAIPSRQTCSAGLAMWDGVESGSELTGRADAALYAAKRSGRDRVGIAATPGPAAAAGQAATAVSG